MPPSEIYDEARAKLLLENAREVVRIVEGSGGWIGATCRRSKSTCGACVE